MAWRDHDQPTAIDLRRLTNYVKAWNCGIPEFFQKSDTFGGKRIGSNDDLKNYWELWSPKEFELQPYQE